MGPENRSAKSYLGNLLTRVSGVETYRQLKREDLADGRGDAVATLYGAMGFLAKLLFPTFFPRSGGRDIERAIKLGLKAGFELNIGTLVPIGIGLNTNSVEAAVTTRIAYHFAVEVVPDALRAIRRKFNLISGSTAAI